MPKSLFLISSVCLLLTKPAAAQLQFTACKVYPVKQADGSVVLMGENHGLLPHSVALEATLTLMRSTVELPARIALPPSGQPQVLTVFTPEQAGYSYRYKTVIDLGIYTGQAPDSSIVYVRPFQTSVDTISTRQKFRNQYIFSLPSGTPLVAAREGIVAYVRQTQRNARQRTKGNTILIYHSDGTYGSYENIAQGSSAVRVGQQVKQGEPIGLFSGNRYEPNFWFTVVYLTKTTVAPAPVLFANDQRQDAAR